MRGIALGVLCGALVGGLANSSAKAQTDLLRAQNLATCLAGRYPTLCKHDWLSGSERTKVDAAERQENLNTCLKGKYPSLCKRNMLTPEQLSQVVLAERRENLTICMNGRYPSLCNHSLLNSDEERRVRAAESAARSTASRPQNAARRSTSGRRYSSGCEDGHWVDSVSDDGTIVKLEDGSVWEVDAADAVDAALWLPTTDIIACDDKLINTEDNEKVDARRLR